MKDMDFISKTSHWRSVSTGFALFDMTDSISGIQSHASGSRTVGAIHQRPYAKAQLYRRQTFAESIEGFLPRYTPRAFAAAIPSIWRSRCRLVSNSAKTPSISRKAERVSTGCSVALRVAPY